MAATVAIAVICRVRTDKSEVVVVFDAAATSLGDHGKITRRMFR